MANNRVVCLALIGLVTGAVGADPLRSSVFINSAYAAKSDSYMCEQANMSVDSDGVCRAIDAHPKRPKGVLPGCPLKGPRPKNCYSETVADPARDTRIGCYARVYHSRHLAEHPYQIVTQMRLCLRQPDQPKAQDARWFTLQIMRRQDTKALRAEGVCLNDGSCFQE